ncbi:MAG: hypothetical protein ACRDTM_07075 [Micromonosporaceae bacterium]
MQTDTADATRLPAERLSSTGRTVRVVVALVVIVGLVFGTWLEDDHFPFGPFKMYSTSDPLNKPVPDTRVDFVNAEGERFKANQDNTGFRRAEVEGQMDRFEEDPELLKYIAQAYEKRRPTRPKIVRVEVVVRWWQLEDGRATGAYTEETKVTWSADGSAR